MIKFDQYKASEASFQERYGDWLKKYPNCALLAESKIREEFDLKNGRRLHEKFKKPIKQYLPSYGNWKGVLYRAAYNTSLAFRLRAAAPKPSIFFYWIKETKKSVTSSGLPPGYRINYGRYPLSEGFSPSSVRLQSITAVSPSIWRAYKVVYESIARDLAVEKSLQSTDKIEELVRREVDKVATLVRKSNIKYIVLGSDQSPYNRILCRAARLAGSKTAVIAHGYFESRHLGGVLPVYSDRLFVWTRLQKEQIDEVIEREQKHKVCWQGFPYPVDRASSVEKRVLVVLDDLPEAETQEWLMAFDTVLDGLIRDGWKVTVRPRRSCDVGLFEERLGDSEIKVRKIDLYTELDQVSYVVGGRSSVAVQAAFYGLFTLRVSDWTDERQTGEGIERVKAKHVAEFLRARRQSRMVTSTNAVELKLNEIVRVLDTV